MSKRLIVGLMAVLAVVGAMVATASAQTGATAPKPQDKLAIGEEQAKQLLLLYRYRQERQDLQTRVDEVYGSSSTDWIRPRTESSTSRN